MNEKNKNLLLRIASAVVLLPLVLWLLYMGSYWTAVLLAVASAACAYEYLQMTNQGLGVPGGVALLGAASMPFAPIIHSHDPGMAALGISAVVGALFFFSWFWHLVRGPLEQAPVRVAHVVSGVLFGGIGLTAVAALRMMPDGGWWVVAALVITWVNDTCAYFAGRFLGKHKLYPAVSPNKTWEGFAGGMVGSIGGLFILRAGFFPGLSVMDCVVIGVLGGICGPAGDLCESMLKRAYGAKDSGNLIPGHGGMLDRIDALLFNAPMLLVYLHLTRH
ncbi:MAG: phosphatidate cytidylyltransferase [Myxococcaceae bacterium]|nr:phosphatidate cytidylyltransferase [Myxococcaceae bacterium]